MTLLSEKVDIYGIGTLIFQFLASHQLYEEELRMTNSSGDGEEARVLQLITSPAEPLLPQTIEESKDATIIRLKTVMRQALHYNAANRPTAQELAKHLKAMYTNPQQQDVVRKSISAKLPFFWTKFQRKNNIREERKLFYRSAGE
jgi:hypothetical protein